MQKSWPNRTSRGKRVPAEIARRLSMMGPTAPTMVSAALALSVRRLGVGRKAAAALTRSNGKHSQGQRTNGGSTDGRTGGTGREQAERRRPES